MASLHNRNLGLVCEVLKEKDRWGIQALRRAGNSIRHIREITHHGQKTISKVLASLSGGASPNSDISSGQGSKLRRSGRRRALEPFKSFVLDEINQGLGTAKLLLELRGQGYSGSLRSLQRFIHTCDARIITAPHEMKDWMHLVLQGGKPSSQIETDVGDTFGDDDVRTLLLYVRNEPLKLRNRALALLAHGKGIPLGHIASFLCIAPTTVRQYISDFKEGGIRCVLDLSRKEVKKAADPNYAIPVFKTLHTPPSAFGINRTAWRMDDLYAVLIKQGVRISRANIRKIIKAAGYRFRKAKKVLTSTDPQYREKLEKITGILAHLKPEEKFFSIDEFGPFAVKIKGGRAWVKPDEIRSVPQRQKSKGSLIATAALELSTNQITHFYSEKKDTDEMIRMLEHLVSQYRAQTRIFFSWDAASWHGSKKFFRRVDEINETAYRESHGTPVVELAPLPSCAQFLRFYG